MSGSEPGESVAVAAVASRAQPDQQINCTAQRMLGRLARVPFAPYDTDTSDASASVPPRLVLERRYCCDHCWLYFGQHAFVLRRAFHPCRGSGHLRFPHCSMSHLQWTAHVPPSVHSRNDALPISACLPALSDYLGHWKNF
jgi:hypothetical protein